MQVLTGEGLVRLNAVAAWIWEELERVPDREALFRRMRRRFRGVSDQRLRADLDAVLDQWLQKAWIHEEEDLVFPHAPDPWPL